MLEYGYFSCLKYFQLEKKMSILMIENLSHEYGDHTLYQKACLRLSDGDHMGITGLNGAGKSTLLRIIMGEVLPDEGQIWRSPKHTLGYLDQHARIRPGQSIRAYLLSAHEDLFAMERQMQQLYEEAAKRQDGGGSLLDRAARLQEKLESSGLYQVEYEMERVAGGLGVSAMGLNTPIENLSGGQRAKVILAKLLLEAPDILLMDEPTNFLDASQVEWLVNFLQHYKGAFMVISHSQEFLERVTNCISDLEFGKITTYRGSFLAAMRQKEFRREEQLRLYASQQREIRKLEDYIARNKVRASTANMAKSREKALARIERLEAPTHLEIPSFDFPAVVLSDQVILEVEDLQIGYDRPLLSPLTFRMMVGDKLVIRGFNGVGKTTLLKTLMGRLPKLGGDFYLYHGDTIGYFEQDLVWPCDMWTPLEYLASVHPDRQPKELRAALSRCGVKRDHMMQTVGTLSGGEQSKVKLAQLSLQRSHLLVLDEPTNHLDQNAKEALIRAVQDFAGAVIMVTHEAGFYERITDWVIELG